MLHRITLKVSQWWQELSLVRTKATSLTFNLALNIPTRDENHPLIISPRLIDLILQLNVN